MANIITTTRLASRPANPTQHPSNSAMNSQVPSAASTANGGGAMSVSTSLPIVQFAPLGTSTVNSSSNNNTNNDNNNTTMMSNAGASSAFASINSNLSTSYGSTSANSNSNSNGRDIPELLQNNSMSSISTSSTSHMGEVVPLAFDRTPEGVCAAGSWCKAPPGTSIYSEDGQISHWCFICGNGIHCQLFCGTFLPDIKDVHGFTIDTRLLPSEIRGRYETSATPRSVVCAHCIDQLRGPSLRLLSEAELAMDDTLGEGAMGVGGETVLGGATDAAAATGTSPIANCTWEHIVVSAGACNLVQKGKKDASNMTRLVGFKVAGQVLPIAKINVTALRTFASGKIDKSRKAKKKDLCDKIVEFKAMREEQRASGTIEPVVPGTDIPIVLNRKRLINVLFGTAVKPKFALRGRTLTKPQLQAGEKTDQALCEDIIREYNKNLPKYSQHAYSYCENPQDASDYTPIPLSAWKKIDKAIKDMSREYEAQVQAWTTSGTHCDFADLVPHENSGHNVQYLHCYMVSNKDLFNVVLSQLPPGIFSESESGAPDEEHVGGWRGRGGRGRGGGKKASSASANALYTEGALSSIREKNFMVESNNCAQLQSTILSNINEQSTYKRERVNELRKCCTGSKSEKRKEAKARIANYKRHKANEKATNNPSADDDSDEEDEYVESQESLIEEIIEKDDQIKSLKDQLSAIQKKVTQYVKSK